MKPLLCPPALGVLLALAPVCAPAQTPDTHHHRFGDAERVSPERVKAEMSEAGYAAVKEHAFLPSQYFLVFEPGRK